MTQMKRSVATLAALALGGTIALAAPATGAAEPIVMRWGTYLGGPSSESILGIASAAEGSITVGGYSFGAGFPTTSGALETEPSGGGDSLAATIGGEGSEFAYGTYLGGNSQDAVHDVVEDASGAVYLVGEAHSSDFPTTEGVVQPASGGGQDVFVAKLASDRSGLAWATYLGGTGYDIAFGVDVGPDGSVYVTGRTSSDDFPTTDDAIRRVPSGRSDIFVTRLSSDGATIGYSTLYGGSNTETRPSSGEAGRAIAVDGSGTVFIAGVTDSSDFPVKSEPPVGTRPLNVRNGGGMGDAFVAKLVPGDAEPAWSGYLGGVGSDTASAIEVDDDGVVHVGGSTESPDFPVFMASQPLHGGFGGYDAWVARIEPGGAGLGWSTFLGGAGNDSISGLARNDDGSLWLAGRTTSSDLATTPDAIQATYGGGAGDGYLTKMQADGAALLYSTFLGGSGSEGISGLARISDDVVLVGGGTDSTDFPITANALQASNAGGVDMFVASIGSPLPTAPPTCRAPGRPTSRPPDGPPPGRPTC